MTIQMIVFMAACSVIGALIVLVRVMGWRWVLRRATLVDIGFTVLVCVALAGTLTGLLIGIVAGLLMTATLTAGRAFLRASESRERVFTPAEDWCPGGTPYRL